MQKPPAHLMIAIGLQRHHGEDEPDEDSLGREQDGDGERHIEDMAQAVLKRDHAALEEAAGGACDVMRRLIGD
jgi:hypothetical protein